MDILDAPDRWEIQWIDSPAAPKRVILVNRTTGQRSTGQDWTSWDRALGAAIHQIEIEGDLVSEIEAHLDLDSR